MTYEERRTIEAADKLYGACLGLRASGIIQAGEGPLERRLVYGAWRAALSEYNQIRAKMHPLE